jgi:hypothetical protein
MHSARLQTLGQRLVIFIGAVTVFTATVSVASAPQDLFTHVETLTLNDGTPVSGPMSFADDIAVVGCRGVLCSGVAYVFERESGGERWVHRDTLVPSDATSDFGQAVATDGQTIVVGAPDISSSPGAGAAYVFQRESSSHAWLEIARLTGDENPDFVGSSVAVSGSTVVVGAPVFFPQGVVYVFERDRGGPNAWGEAARLTGPADPPALGFGGTVAIDRDTVIVGAATPPFPGMVFPFAPVAHVFSRDAGGQNAWESVATLSSGAGLSDSPGPAGASLSGDTAIVGGGLSGGRGGATRIFQRDRGGPDGWGQVTEYTYPAGTGVGDWSIGGNLAVAGASTPSDVGVTVYARHQGGKDAWGEVERIHVPSFVTSSIAAVLSGDTVFLDGASPNTPIEVYVADTDRDGRRDGIDPCPRDPLDNVEGGCMRNGAAYLVLDDLITLGDVTTEAVGDELHVTATFTNTSDTAIGNPFFEVVELTGGNVLMNADAGPGGTGATLSPDVGDGILSPAEPTTVSFVIGLETREVFRFYVSVKGEPRQ